VFCMIQRKKRLGIFRYTPLTVWNFEEEPCVSCESEAEYLNTVDMNVMF
jgi:hypothetical protein